MINIINKTKTSLKEKVKIAAKQTGFEAGEIVKHAESQIAGSDVHESPIVEAMQMKSENAEMTQEEKVKRRNFMNRVERFEEEYKKYVMLRKQMEEESKKQVISTGNDNIVNPGGEMEKLIIPKSQPQRGKPPSPGKQTGTEYVSSKK